MTTPLQVPGLRPAGWLARADRSPGRPTASAAVMASILRAGLPARPVARAAVVALALMTTACSPEYDWRESRSEAGWTVMLPGRPSSATRDILLGELPVKMTMQGARAGDAAFTVAAAVLPDAQPATQARAIAAMREALVRNIAGRETAAVATTVARVDGSGRRTGTAAGIAIEAVGQVRGAPAQLRARLIAHERRALQALVVGPAIDPEQADTFFDSLRLHD